MTPSRLAGHWRSRKTSWSPMARTSGSHCSKVAPGVSRVRCQLTSRNRGVAGPLQITAHPVNGIGDAAQHGLSVEGWCGTGENASGGQRARPFGNPKGFPSVSLPPLRVRTIRAPRKNIFPSVSYSTFQQRHQATRPFAGIPKGAALWPPEASLPPNQSHPPPLPAYPAGPPKTQVSLLRRPGRS